MLMQLVRRHGWSYHEACWRLKKQLVQTLNWNSVGRLLDTIASLDEPIILAPQKIWLPYLMTYIIIQSVNTFIHTFFAWPSTPSTLLRWRSGFGDCRLLSSISDRHLSPSNNNVYFVFQRFGEPVTDSQDVGHTKRPPLEKQESLRFYDDVSVFFIWVVFVCLRIWTLYSVNPMTCRLANTSSMTTENQPVPKHQFIMLWLGLNVHHVKGTTISLYGTWEDKSQYYYVLMVSILFRRILKQR